jgi:hypothetical protein
MSIMSRVFPSGSSVRYDNNMASERDQASQSDTAALAFEAPKLEVTLNYTSGSGSLSLKETAAANREDSFEHDRSANDDLTFYDRFAAVFADRGFQEAWLKEPDAVRRFEIFKAADAKLYVKPAIRVQRNAGAGLPEQISAHPQFKELFAALSPSTPAAQQKLIGLIQALVGPEGNDDARFVALNKKLTAKEGQLATSERQLSTLTSAVTSAITTLGAKPLDGTGLTPADSQKVAVASNDLVTSLQNAMPS